MSIALPPFMGAAQDVNGAQLLRHLPEVDGHLVTLPEDMTYVFIVFLNRSGSTLLSELLYATGFYNHAEEILNAVPVTSLCSKQGLTSVANYFSHSVASAAQNNHFVAKVSLGQIGVLNHYGILPRIFERSRFLITERMDKVSQAVSFAIATQTKKFYSYQERRAIEPVYDGPFIADRFYTIIRHHARINMFMSLNGIVPLHLTYEFIALHPELACKLTCEYLGTPDLQVDLTKLRLEKMATPLNDQWREKFLKERPKPTAAQLQWLRL